MWTEFASGSTNPETGTAGEDRERLARWPWAIGAGSTLHLKWPLDFRVCYSRALTDWIVVDEGGDQSRQLLQQFGVRTASQ